MTREQQSGLWFIASSVLAVIGAVLIFGWHALLFIAAGACFLRGNYLLNTAEITHPLFNMKDNEQ